MEMGKYDRSSGKLVVTKRWVSFRRNQQQFLHNKIVRKLKFSSRQIIFSFSTSQLNAESHKSNIKTRPGHRLWVKIWKQHGDGIQNIAKFWSLSEYAFETDPNVHNWTPPPPIELLSTVFIYHDNSQFDCNFNTFC